jgi:hypothetical protein
MSIKYNMERLYDTRNMEGARSPISGEIDDVFRALKGKQGIHQQAHSPPGDNHPVNKTLRERLSQ